MFLRNDHELTGSQVQDAGRMRKSTTKNITNPYTRVDFCRQVLLIILEEI